jgi:hypothetical protein
MLKTKFGYGTVPENLGQAVVIKISFGVNDLRA